MQIERVLVVGLGSIGTRHLRLARSLLPDADIRVLRRQMTDTVPVFADGCLINLSQAREFAPQIAVIANPAPFHVEIAKALAESGVHLLVEKPISDSLEGIQSLIDSCHQRELVLLIGYNLRFQQSLKYFRKLLHDGIVGRTISVRCEIGQYLPMWRPGADYRFGVSANRQLGGGVLLELSHELDYLRWIFGEINWVQASLFQQSALEIDVEDTAHLILGFMPDEHGKYLVGNVNLDFVRHDVTRVCVAIGELGSLRWNGIAGTVEHIAAGEQQGWQEIFRHLHMPDESYQFEWEHFLACIERRALPLISAKDGLEVLRIVEAARLSSDSGCRIHIQHGVGAGKIEP